MPTAGKHKLLVNFAPIRMLIPDCALPNCDSCFSWGEEAGSPFTATQAARMNANRGAHQPFVILPPERMQTTVGHQSFVILVPKRMLRVGVFLLLVVLAPSGEEGAFNLRGASRLDKCQKQRAPAARNPRSRIISTAGTVGTYCLSSSLPYQCRADNQCRPATCDHSPSNPPLEKKEALPSQRRKPAERVPTIGETIRVPSSLQKQCQHPVGTSRLASSLPNICGWPVCTIHVQFFLP